MPEKPFHSIRIKGLVQGVGFRPHIWRVANKYKIKGEVLNDGEGVLIHAQAGQAMLDKFIYDIKIDTPPLARIDDVLIMGFSGEDNYQDFQITQSRSGVISTGVVPDAATCAQCVLEIFDKTNRRYGYGFTNCTHCGPRLSITKQIPYDRAHTSMAEFKMCVLCQGEYDDPADRRFHAQPNACETCGPKLWLCGKDGAPIHVDNAIQKAASLISGGAIIAIKGIGGFHLACSASHSNSVSELRRRKKRYGKPFALMAADIATIRTYCEVNAQAQSLLESTAAPIVLLPIIKPNNLPEALASGQNRLGFMLPYTPLHHLLCAQLNTPIVLTSANISDEPQVIDNDEALKRLDGLADYFLMHDRDIVNRLDDSVVQLVGGTSQVLRRARGLAPAPILLPKGFEHAPNILALGGDLKNTFCLLSNGQAVLSQHMGDLEKPTVHADFRKNLSFYQDIGAFKPDIIAVDKHPGYYSTRWGEDMSGTLAVDILHVQHHHAHIAACLAEHNHGLGDGLVLGIALDGLGYGEDGTIWGGEFLIADYKHCKRVAHFPRVPLIGGAKAMREPWRNTLAHLLAVDGWDVWQEKHGNLDVMKYLSNKPITQIQIMIERGINAPLASSAGRLFDGVAGALGLHVDGQMFEGQAAMALQALAESAPLEKGLYYKPDQAPMGWAPLWRGILQDLKTSLEKNSIAARFHNSLAHVIARNAKKIVAENGLKTIVLSGGVFQNSLLLTLVLGKLKQDNLTVLTPTIVPANDGGIALGQAVIAAARNLNDNH